MPSIDVRHNFFHGLSDFWQRFFADSTQLERLYEGTAVLVGQAYLDLLSNVLSVSLRDTPVFNKEYYRLLAIREDELVFRRGASSDDDRWVHPLREGLVSFLSLDNRVIEPTAMLEEDNDYDLAPKQVCFKADPTDHLNDGSPLPGFAHRSVDVAVGGKFGDTTADAWKTSGARKGDTLRLLDIGAAPDGVARLQRKRTDHPIAIVRDAFLAVSAQTPLPAVGPAYNYVVLRRPYNDKVTFEPLAMLSLNRLGHTRIDEGSLRVFARRLIGGGDVVEGTDYTVNYESGKLRKLSDWTADGLNAVSYSWQQEVWPTTMPLPDAGSPRYAVTGRVLETSPSTTSVRQVAFWAPDAQVDRRLLANNFGSLIGNEQDSSEAYRAFLQGIFQLYIMGPVLERIESAINILLGMPVVRDDNEVLLGVDTADPLVNRVRTRRPSGQIAIYEFTKLSPLRADVVNVANVGRLRLHAFEPLTTAVTVTDYVQDPTWWHNTLIPQEIFAKDAGDSPPLSHRRRAHPAFVKHVYGASDGPRFGDPGLKFGADENGFQPPPGHAVFRHRLAFVLMDSYLKFHMFFVKFNPLIFSEAHGARYRRTFEDLESLVFSAKPAHTYLLVQPVTVFNDVLNVAEEGYYQPQRFVGAAPDGPEVFDAVGRLSVGPPYAVLGLFLNLSLGSPQGQPDQVKFADNYLRYGINGWRFGDYFRYKDATYTLDLLRGVAVDIPGSMVAPRRRHLVRVYVNATAAGRRVVENVDYTIDHDAVPPALMALTEWDAPTGVTVKVLQCIIGNVADAPADASQADMGLIHAGLDPGLRTADYSGAFDWFGLPIPPGLPRDISCVERALTLRVS